MSFKFAASTKSGSDRTGSRIGSRTESRIMDRIMLNKRRNFAWQAKIKSAWHSWVQAPWKFFAQKPHRLDHVSKKKRVWKIKQSNPYKIINSLKKKDVKKLKYFNENLRCCIKCQNRVWVTLECRSIWEFSPKLHVVTFTAVLRSVVSCCHGQKLAILQSGEGHWGFLVLQFWLILDWYFGFLCQKTLVFQFSPFWFADFMWFSIWFLVFVKNGNGFLNSN